MKKKKYEYIIQSDSILTIILVSYFLIRWNLLIAFYGYLIYLILLILITTIILIFLILEFYIYRKKILFKTQLIISISILVIYSIMVFISIVLLMEILTMGAILFSILFIVKLFRILVLFHLVKKLKKENSLLKLSFYDLIQKKVLFGFISILIIISLFIITLSIIPARTIGFEVDLEKKNLENGDSSQLKLSFYATLSSYEYLTDEKILRLLDGKTFQNGKSNPIDIILLIRETSLTNVAKSQKLAKMIQSCNNHQIHVWVYFVYSKEHGYYPSYEDYDYLPKFKKTFDKWVNKSLLRIHGIVFDNEWDQNITNSWIKDDEITFLKNLLQHRQKSKQGWKNATGMYERIAKEWKKQGYEVALVGSEFSLYDTLDEDPDLQQLFGIVNNPPDVWDRVSYMLYRGCGTEEMGQDTVYLLSKLHKEINKERAVAALGCMGYYPYLRINQILEDIALMKYQGYETIELFEFGTFFKTFGYNGLLKVLETTIKGWNYDKFFVKFTLGEFLARSFLLLADILLDLY